MGEVEIVAAQEVVSEREFYALQIREHVGRFEVSLKTTLDEALRIGECAQTAKATFSEQEIQRGEFARWVDATLSDVISDKTLRKFMRLYRDRSKLKAVPHGEEPIGPATAEQVLTELNKGETDDPQEALERVRQAQRKADESAQKARKRAKREAEKAKKFSAEIAELKVVQKEREKAISEQLKANLQQELSEVYARYGIEESPSLFEVDPAAFAKAVESSRNEREVEALKLLEQAFSLVSKMRQYEPDEAARAFLKWPSPERSQEAIEEITEWLNSCKEEVQMHTTPGKLRVVGAKGE